MDIFALAAQLGDALKQNEKLVALSEARRAYVADREIQNLVVEYGVQQKALQLQAKQAEVDTHLVDMIQARIDELYAQISTNEHYAALEAAQNEVNELMNAVNQTITMHITDAPAGGCTHNCATCGGCH